MLELRVVGDAHDVSLGAFGEFEYAHCFFDVDEGEDELLEEEADHLDFLHDVVALDEVVEGAVAEGVGVGAEGKDAGGETEDDDVGADHVEGVSCYAS